MPSDDTDGLRRRFEQQAAEIAELKRQLAASQAAGPASRQQASGENAIAAREIRLLIQGNVFGDIVSGPGAAERKRRRMLLENYLLRVLGERGVARVDLLLGSGKPLKLEQIYTSLETTLRDVPPAQGKSGLQSPDEVFSREGLEAPPLSAAAFASKHRFAVIHGPPGSGKSTFLEIIAAANAGAFLVDSGGDSGGLAVLGGDWKPTPTSEPLLPVFITLRQFAAELVPDRKTKPPSLWKHVESNLGDGCKGLAGPLRDHLHEYGGLFLLDGFDEVPENPGTDTASLRAQVKAAVAALIGEFPRARFLLTARTYAYRQQDWALQGFEAAELAPFDKEKREEFIRRWFEHLPQVRPSLTPEAAAHRSRALTDAIAAGPQLRDLASRPLLLTLMASLCAREGRLPEDRAELYERSVELLLENWQQPKHLFRGERCAADTALSLPVAEFLKTTGDKVAAALDALAFTIHQRQGHQAGAADIPLGDLLAALTSAAGAEVNPVLLAEYVCDRAGLLLHDGQQVYRFPHRSFQEFLAARSLCSRADFPAEAARLVSLDPDRWREVYLLAVRRVAKAPYTQWAVIQETLALQEARRGFTGFWTAQLCAGLAVEESGLAAELSGATRPHFDHLRQRLADLVRQGHLSAADRTAAGAVLGRLGDPRPGTGCTAYGLPDIGGDYWVEIPEGPFLYGDQKERRELATRFRIARFPVTVAQYQAFVDDGGYAEERWWTAEGAREFVSENPDPMKSADAFLPPNHPRVDISWFEASAFCAWLSRCTGRRLALPEEVQWERAARGTSGREYPWDGTWEDNSPENHANMGRSKIGHTSAVGAFPAGATPEGICDMAGNVWEWCSDWYDPERRGRVLRGVSWLFVNPDYMRASFRGRFHPHVRNDGVGFRLVELPPF